MQADDAAHERGGEDSFVYLVIENLDIHLQVFVAAIP